MDPMGRGYRRKATRLGRTTQELEQQLGRPPTTEEVARYLSQTERMDWIAGELLDTLDELGLTDDTLFVFVSDNGAVKPAYRDELAGLAERLTEMVKAGDADWQAVDSDAFARLKQELDTKSIRLQEIGIAESLKER